MHLGLFFMPLHRHDKPWAQALAEDRQAILLADRCGYAEVWVGEHFSTSAERIPSPLMFLSSLIHETSMRLGTGVVNLGHRHPIVVAAEAAQFDQMSGGRLMLGVGPGGLASDAELFGRPDMDERAQVAREAIDMILELWTAKSPFSLEGEHFSASLVDQTWLSQGVGELAQPAQRPHPPLAMAMVSPGGPTAELIAEKSMIPISANFVPVDFVAAQWASYAAKRDELGLEADPAVWRVCRNVLVTESAAEAEAAVSDPDGVFAHYFRYLRGVAKMTDFDQTLSVEHLNAELRVDKAIESCVIAGTAAEVTERLVEMADTIGGFGTLVAVGHDWDDTDMWQRSTRALAEDVAPALAQHVDSLIA